jgi:trehalose 6-phosphate synthase/phosphatase
MVEPKSYPELIIASNRSPIDYNKGGDEAPSVGGLTQSMVPCLGPNDLWYAVSGGDNDPNLVDERGIIHAKGKNYEFDLGKIFLKPRDYEAYYRGFANGFIWPIFHFDKGAYHEKSTTYPRPRFDGNEYFSYYAVNKEFAKAILNEVGENTTVWIQDYHLLLLAEELKKRKPSLPVGQFIHIPMFHPAHIEKYLERYKQTQGGIEVLLSQMLANDLLGFQVDDYVQNFANAIRVLVETAKVTETDHGVEIIYKGKKCSVESFPIGTDVEGISTQVQAPLHIPLPNGGSVEEVIAESRKNGRRILVGLERGDYTKGLVERLEIVDKMLEMGEKVTYVGVVCPSREGIEAYKELVEQVNLSAKAINSKWLPQLGYDPVNLLFQEVKPPQNYALLREGDCVMITTIADGMNLVYNEAVLSKQNLPHEARGLIALGNCGAERLAREHRWGDQHGVVRVDPFDPERAAEDILASLHNNYNISDPVIAHVKSMDVNIWRDSFLNRLRERNPCHTT